MKKAHTDREYEAQLQNLRGKILLMAGEVEGMIAKSMEALLERNVPLAEETIARDQEVNRYEKEADELCLLILAKWQPMASDLRFLTIGFKMVTDLERIGDLAVNICERAIDLSKEPILKPFEDTPKMARIVQTMVRDAIDSFVHKDSKRARDVIERDDEVDDLYDKIFTDILQLMKEDSKNIRRCIHIQSVAKWLERMADHTTNLAEQVILMVEGKDVRHEGKLH